MGNNNSTAYAMDTNNGIRNISKSEFQLISEIGREVISTLDVKEVIQRIYSNVNKLLDAQIFAIGLCNEPNGTMDIWGIKLDGKVDLINKSLFWTNVTGFRNALKNKLRF